MRLNVGSLFGLVVATLHIAIPLHAQVIVEHGVSQAVRVGGEGKLVYAEDERGSRLPDFSFVGYHGGERAIPNVAVRMTVQPVEGDNTEHLQKAIDKLGELTQDERGFRGTLLLKRGTYPVEGVLRINHSGIVLRGEGDGPDGTVIVAAGFGGKKFKRTLITVGNNNPPSRDLGSKRRITADYVPIGANRFEIETSAGYVVGDRILLHRPATQEWISAIGCDKLAPKWETRDGKRVDVTVQWTPDRYHMDFERTIVAIDDRHITIDAPNVHPLDAKYGGGFILKYTAPDRVTEVGIEHLRLVSQFGEPSSEHPFGPPSQTTQSELHGWNAIKLARNTENTWVRNVTTNYFGWSSVSASGKRATVTDCVSLGHASQITGGRRYPFMLDGQLNLMQRCITIEGRHEFVNQALTAGPNVFVDCVGFDSKSSAGPHHRYAVGNLYDNVKSERYMESRFRGNSGTGHGWAGTQTCFYNCIAPSFNVKAPPGGISWVIGSASESEVMTDGRAKRVEPASLYYAQVSQRLGKAALDHLVLPNQIANMGQYPWVAARLRQARGE